jgi:hypothetical protein
MGLFSRRSSQPENSQPETQELMVIAMIALPEAGWPDSARMAESLARRFSDAPPLVHTSSQDNSMLFDYGGLKAIVSLMPAPIPWDDLEFPCASNPFWPEATDKMQAHTAHFVVVLMGDSTPLSIRIHLTRLVACILDCHPCTGVYWGESSLVHSPETFLEMAPAATLNAGFPASLWINLQLVPNPDRTVSLLTLGMEAFGLMELEVLNSEKEPAEVYSRVGDLAAYLITQGPVIRDGDTIGQDATERITVRHRPSVFPNRSLVYQVQM